MALEYRKEMDIGFIEGETPIIQYVDEERHGQVYQATHDGEGNSLSAIEKSLISFSWGGKNIEDFSLLAVNDGDRYTGNLYTGFKDLITDYDIVDGQQYWGTTYSANTKDFQLATDGMTEKTLQEFKSWFKPGIERELILAEHPNRAIKARVSVTPQYSLLPFEHTEELVLGEQVYSVISTLWKGSITLNFVMDDPFWYSIEDRFRSTAVHPLTSTQLNAIIEDGVPEAHMFNVNCLLPMNYYYDNTRENYYTNTGVELDSNKKQYLYYCGSAPEKPIISFNMALTFTDRSNNVRDYLQLPGNRYSNIIRQSSIYVTKKNPVTQAEETVTTFSFGAPDIILSFNKVIDILKNDFESGDSIIELRTAIRDTVSHPIVRKVALGICDRALQHGLSICNVSTSELVAGGCARIITEMKKMFASTDPIECHFIFNSKLGQAKIRIPVKILTNDTTQIQFTEVAVNEENNIGDAVKSRYLVLNERTLPNSNNLITENECLCLFSNCPIKDFKIEYKYRYL